MGGLPMAPSRRRTSRRSTAHTRPLSRPGATRFGSFETTCRSVEAARLTEKKPMNPYAAPPILRSRETAIRMKVASHLLYCPGQPLQFPEDKRLSCYAKGVSISPRPMKGNPSMSRYWLLRAGRHFRSRHGWKCLGPDTPQPASQSAGSSPGAPRLPASSLRSPALRPWAWRGCNARSA